MSVTGNQINISKQVDNEGHLFNSWFILLQVIKDADKKIEMQY